MPTSTKPLRWVASSKKDLMAMPEEVRDIFGYALHLAQVIEIEESSGNVYADLQVADAEAMHVKARLASKIDDIIRHRHLTQQQAAEILGIPQPKLSRLLRGQFRGISEIKMIECLNRLGRDVEIVVRKAPPGHPLGKTHIVFI